MDRDQAKEHIKGEMGNYLASKGIDTGKRFRCLNPAHSDRNPSMGYDRGRQKAHCFSCGADYDILDLIGIDHGLTGADIFSKAYELYGVTVSGTARPKPTGPVQATGGQTGQPTRAETDPAGFFDRAHEHVGETDYPGRRGLGKDVVDRFRLGYVEDWTHPKALNAPPSPRLIIPTGGDSYLARDTREALTPEQRRYSKSKVGKSAIFNAEALATAVKPVFVVEGEIDAMSVFAAGGEAVALGSVSNRRLFLDTVAAARPAQPLIIALDNDEAGLAAADALALGLRGLGVAFCLRNPYGGCKDANEALMVDAPAFALAVAEAERTCDDGRAAAHRMTSVAAHLDSLRAGMAAGSGTTFLPTGFARLDEALDGGLGEGLYVIGAISSLGKTTLVVQVVDQIAVAGSDVLVFSLEMPMAEIMAKSISRHTLMIEMGRTGGTGRAKTARGITTGGDVRGIRGVREGAH
jgi:replicative DNA helicase